MHITTPQKNKICISKYYFLFLLIVLGLIASLAISQKLILTKNTLSSKAAQPQDPWSPTATPTLRPAVEVTKVKRGTYFAPDGKDPDGNGPMKAYKYKVEWSVGTTGIITIMHYKSNDDGKIWSGDFYARVSCTGKVSTTWKDCMSSSWDYMSFTVYTKEDNGNIRIFQITP